MSIEAEFSVIGLVLLGAGLVFIAAAALETLGVLAVSKTLKTSKSAMLYLGVFSILMSTASAIENSAPEYVTISLFLIAALCLVTGVRLEVAARRLLNNKALQQAGER